MTTQTLAAIDNQAMTPAQYQSFVTEAEGKARVLTDIVERQKLYTVIGTKKHLHVEAWEVLGAGYGLSARTAPNSTEPLYAPDGKLLGVRARVEIVDSNGIARGGAESFCTYDETETKRDGTIYKRWEGHPLAQLAGMAQTRATARAYRQMIAWVVQLAGYSPTPFEELDADRTIVEGQAKPSESEYGVCDIHKIAYFKRGKMPSPAHRTEDGAWCNKPAEKPATPAVTLVPAKAVGDARLDPLNVENRKALHDIGYQSAEEILGVLGIETVMAWLYAHKDKNIGDVVALLREAKAAVKAM